MTEPLEFKLTIDASLIDYFLNFGHESPDQVADSLIDFLASFLNDTRYPLAARRVDEREIVLKYRPKAFADPIFD